MTLISQIRDGLTIISAYGDSGLACEHDIIYAGDVPPAKMEKSDVVELGVCNGTGMDAWTPGITTYRGNYDLDHQQNRLRAILDAPLRSERPAGA